MTDHPCPNPLICLTRTTAQTQALGAALADMLQPGDILALNGELGAGKTSLVRGLAQGLGIDPHAVSSPTFVLMHEYVCDQAPGPDRPQVILHVDAYRLKTPADFDSLGGDLLEDLASQGAMLVVEWADKVRERLGEDCLEMLLAHDEDGRTITLQGCGTWADRMQQIGRIIDALATRPASPKPRPVQCPTCKAPVSPETSSFPFCSSRCRQRDLGRWLDGSYTISRPLEQADFEEG